MRTALAIFVIAALTDHFDGRIARIQGVTSFGKFMDPLADKLLISAALICLALSKHVDDGLIAVWMVIVILGRELLVTLLRIVFIAKYGEVVSASQWGKYKMTSQLIVVAIGLLLLTFRSEQATEFILKAHGPIYFLMYLPLALTVGSGIEFLVNNRKALSALILSTHYDPEAGA